MRRHCGGNRPCRYPQLSVRVPSTVSLRDLLVPELDHAFDALVAQVACTAARRPHGEVRASVLRYSIEGARLTSSHGVASKCVRWIDLGGSRVTTQRDFVEAVREATGRGSDVVLDVIEATTGSIATSTRSHHGRSCKGARWVGQSIVTVANYGQVAAASSHHVRHVPRREDRHHLVRPRYCPASMPAIRSGDRHALLTAEMADAHRMMEANANFGKIAIDVQPNA